MNDSQPIVFETVDQVINTVGGTAAAARLVRASPASVSNWRAAGRLPSRTFLIFREALAALGATAPAALWSIDEPSPADTHTETDMASGNTAAGPAASNSRP